ncbi:MAG: hypothetical protein AB7G37_00820 [Solirubrobacteraceae bacterium]
MTRRKPVPDESVLRDVAVGLLNVARTQDLGRLVAELTVPVDGQDVRVEVTIDRDVPTGAEAVDDQSSPTATRVAEHVTVKAGPKSQPRVVVAAPARWVDR